MRNGERLGEAALFPERRLRNAVAPEGLPSRDGRLVNTKQRRKLVDPARRWTLPHGADQDHHGTVVIAKTSNKLIRIREFHIDYVGHAQGRGS